MDINNIVSIISSVGFPIVCCIIMFKIYREDLRKLQETIDKNTTVIQSLAEMIRGMKDG